MLIHGREVHFLLTVGATKKIARLCPDNDIQNISLIFEAKDTDKMIDTLAALAETMSEGYEKQQKYINPSYKPQPLTQEEVLSLTINELSDLQNELMNEIGAGMATDVDAEPEKTKLKKTDEATE
jgi:hypothetical protein